MPEFYEEIEKNTDIRRIRATLLLLTGELVCIIILYS